MLSVGVAILLVYWRKKVVDDKKEKINWYVALVVMCLVFVGATVSQAISVSDCLYDINHEAFVVHDSGFSVETESQWQWHGPTTTEYYVTFHDGEKDVEIRISEGEAEAYGLPEGEYTDMILVYGERSELLVDVWEVTNESK